MSRTRRHLLLLLFALLLRVLVPSCALGAGSAGARWPAKNPFSPSSFWNKPLGADAPLSPYSAHYAAELERQVDEYHPWMNTTSYSVPVYVVPRHEPTQHVTL